MNESSHWTIRSTSPGDRSILSSLLATAFWKHEHLDWVNASDLLGSTPFLMALKDGQPIGCLACLPELPAFSWVRVFAVAAGNTPSHVWDALWSKATTEIVSLGVVHAAALIIGDWLAPILRRHGFEKVNDVIFLEWHNSAPPRHDLSLGTLRPMVQKDLPAVAKLDQRAFRHIWRYSETTVREAFKQAAIATVIEFDGRLVGYQISTVSIYGAHLARLAVAPECQGRGFGKALVADVLHTFCSQGNYKVSVNTQTDNEPSLKIYNRLGFRTTGIRYPVYQTELPAP